MKDIILFSQAPADIQYVLALYDKYNVKHNIIIVVVNVENSFKYFNSLKLNAKIKFVPLVGQNQILKFLLYIFKLRKIYKELFSKSIEDDVYFFSNNYDYVTAFFIEKLKKNNNIYFFDIYKIDGKELESYKYIIKKIIIKLVFSIDIKFFYLPPSIAYQYKFDNNKIKNIDLLSNHANIDKFKYKIEKINNKKNLLFFESNGEESEEFLNYENTMIKILDDLKDQYNIYIKPHPRLGYSKILNKYKSCIIPDYIPSELLDINCFDVVFGIDSASIATAQHKNKFSLIDMFEFSNNQRKEYLKDYLNSLSDSKLNYVYDIKEIF